MSAHVSAEASAKVGGTGGTLAAAGWSAVSALVVSALAALALAALTLFPAPPAAAAETKPTVALSLQEVVKGTGITVTGAGWRAKTMVMLLVCGQNMIGGTNSCANADGVAVAVADDGRFTAQLPVVEPPKPCPCVVNVSSVNGDQSTVAAPLKITDHPVAELPTDSGTARLAVLTGVRLEGDDGVLTWFGAPPTRKFTVTVGNLGSAPVTDPVFQLGTAHGVFAPCGRRPAGRAPSRPAARRRSAWTPPCRPGPTATTPSPSSTGTRSWPRSRGAWTARTGSCSSGACSCWSSPPPSSASAWPSSTGSDRAGPRPAAAPGRQGAGGGGVGGDGPTAADPGRTGIHARPARRHPGGLPQTTTAVLPWFTPDSAPGSQAPPGPPAPQASAPSENRPTTKGHS